jgi:hypothetical protein
LVTSNNAGVKSLPNSRASRGESINGRNFALAHIGRARLAA